MALGDSPSYNRWLNQSRIEEHSGICYQRSELSLHDVTDGTTYTYMCGEKYLSASGYEAGSTSGDDESLYTGYSDEAGRTVSFVRQGGPRQDTPGLELNYIFGSPHVAGFHMAMCDGSVRAVNFKIDERTHRSLGNRHDGIVID